MNWSLKLALLRAGRSARQVAQEAGMSPNILSRIVCGHRVATAEECSSIARALGEDVRELFPSSGDQRAA